MGCPCQDRIEVLLTCLTCGRQKKYAYRKTRTLETSLKIRRLSCKCGNANFDLDNPVEVQNGTPNNS